MNPILLKPCGDARSQLVLRGRVAGEISARASCLLVADIDRGGVFASLVGTFALLPAADGRRIRGFVVNRFRGDPSLFRSGVTFLEKRLSRPCLGVVPYLRDLGLEEEDGAAMSERRTPSRCWSEDGSRGRRLRVGVVALPKMANFTDFDPLGAEPSVELAFLTRASDVRRADLVVLPGSKQTLDDLGWLKREGFAAALTAHVAAGGRVIGICGGMQMLGREVVDSAGQEGGGRAQGLGLLGLRSMLGSEKVTVRARAVLRERRLFGRAFSGAPLDGYEIHLGTTRYDALTSPLFRLRREGTHGEIMDGATGQDGRVVGTYLHGLFDADSFRHALVRALRGCAGLAPPSTLARYTAERERRFDRLAHHFRQALDIELIEGWLR